jgi:lysozyme family protein
MRPDDAAMIARLIRREGGYVDDPKDTGRCTCWGVTRATLSDWRGHQVTCAEVKALTVDEATRIYADRYLKPWGGIADPALRELLFDSSVQHGCYRLVRWLQLALGIEDDGVWRTSLIDEANAGPAHGLYTAILRRRIVFYGEIVTSKPGQAAFAEGWARRVATFVVAMAVLVTLGRATAQAQTPVKNPTGLAWQELAADHALTTRYEVGYWLTGGASPVQTVNVPVASVTPSGAEFTMALPRPALGTYTATLRACADATPTLCSDWSNATVPFSLTLRAPATLAARP